MVNMGNCIAISGMCYAGRIAVSLLLRIFAANKLKTENYGKRKDEKVQLQELRVYVQSRLGRF